jgi:hypothetical protein
VIAKFAKLVALAGVLALSASCGDFVRQGRSPVMLVVGSLVDAEGAGTMQSDVIVDGGTFNDNATATLTAQLKDPGSLGEAATPTAINQIVIDRYHVEYRRTDGRNTPGIDVPYAFDSALTATVIVGSPIQVPFQIVRHSAKEEAPLAALRLGTGTGHFISTIATVTFYGHDLAGNNISAAGNMGIDFADFADEN